MATTERATEAQNEGSDPPARSYDIRHYGPWVVRWGQRVGRHHDRVRQAGQRRGVAKWNLIEREKHVDGDATAGGRGRGNRSRTILA